VTAFLVFYHVQGATPAASQSAAITAERARDNIQSSGFSHCPWLYTRVALTGSFPESSDCRAFACDVGVGAADAGGCAGAASARATAATDAADAAADAADAAADAAGCVWLLPHAVGVLATGAADGTTAELRPTHADSRRTGTRPSCTLPPLRSLARCLRNGTAAQRRTTCSDRTPGQAHTAREQAPCVPTTQVSATSPATTRR
jgi:hypothetical protein